VLAIIFLVAGFGLAVRRFEGQSKKAGTIVVLSRALGIGLWAWACLAWYSQVPRHPRQASPGRLLHNRVRSQFLTSSANWEKAPLGEPAEGLQEERSARGNA